MAYLDLKKARVYYSITGKGEPLVFLPGMNLDIRAYGRLIELLGTAYKVYAMDLPMHGLSGDFSGEPSPAGLESVVSQFVNELGLKNPSICGHSAGGMIATYYGINRKAKELILLDPAGVRMFDDFIEPAARMILYKPFAALPRNPAGLAHLGAVSGMNLARNLLNRKFWSLIMSYRSTDLTDDLPKIRCPVYLMWARQDEMLSYKYAQAYQQAVKELVMIPVDGSHDWPSLNPEEIQGFLDLKGIRKNGPK